MAAVILFSFFWLNRFLFSRLSFLHGDYKDSAYYFECLEMLRKILLSSVLYAISQNFYGVDIGFAIMVTFLAINLQVANHQPAFEKL